MIATSFAGTFARRIARPLVVALATASILAVASSASAAIIVDSQGFEQPLFTTTFDGDGKLEGQTPATFNGTWARTKGIANSTANVQNTIVQSGSQAVVVNRAANSDDRWGVLVQGYPAERFVCIHWDMRVEQTTGPAGTFGPFFGMEAYDTDAASLGLLGSLGVDASNGEVLYQVQDTGVLTAAGPTVAFGTWHNYMVELDYFTHTYTFVLDGVVLGSEGFVDQNNVVGGLNEFTDATISALAAAGDAASQALVGQAFFDNFLVQQSSISMCVPEPSTIAMVMLGLGFLARRRLV